ASRGDRRTGRGRGAGHGHVGARVQALQVAGQRLDLLVGQVGGDPGHDLELRVVGQRTGAGAELLEPARGVIGVLAADARVGRARVAGAGGAVAGHAGGDAAREVAAAVELLAHLVELHAVVRAAGDHGVVGDAGARALLREVR